jgi:hypothetical protein
LQIRHQNVSGFELQQFKDALVVIGVLTSGKVPSGKWLELGLALSPGSTKVSFQAARSIG